MLLQRTGLAAIFALLLVCLFSCSGDPGFALTADNARLQQIKTGFAFTEGPAASSDGTVYFSDIPKSSIYTIGPDNTVNLFMENTERSNGLGFDAQDTLFACQQDTGHIVRIVPNGNTYTVAETYNQKKFNGPNDLWIAPDGGLYFSDPFFSFVPTKKMDQDGEHVYYVSPENKAIVRVADDLKKPNGIIGTPDGATLYIADQGAQQVFKYSINADGTLADKTLFAQETVDGMTMDALGNIYMAAENIVVYNPAGEKIGGIEVPGRPSNMCFGGADFTTLYITAQKSVFSLQMKVAGSPM